MTVGGQIWSLSLIGLLLASGCSLQGNQSTAQPVPARPTLTELVPNTATTGSAGILILRGANFVSGATIRTPPGLALSNIRVVNTTEIDADYAISSDSYLGLLNVTVTTTGGTSEPVKFKIVPGATVFQFGVPVGAGHLPATAGGAPSFESFDVGIHTNPVDNPDGSYTDAYLDVSFTDDKGRPVAVGDSWHSDMDNVVSPDDPNPGPNVTSYSFGLQRPAAGEYVLHINGSKSGSFVLEIDTEASSSHESLGVLENVPTYPGSSFELKFLCRRAPYKMAVAGGGLQPVHGAFSFAQPLTSEVRLPADEKTLGVVIYYDLAIEPSSFRALLDGSDRSELFHVSAGELQLVSVPLEHGQHALAIRANTKDGLSTVQEFHLQH